MLIPKTGKVVILDDKENQSLPLLKALSKNKIPCVLHSEKAEDLPTQPYSDTRVLFLDINLTSSTDEKDIRSVLIKTLNQIVSPGSVYILAIWSVKEDLVGIVLDIFQKELIHISPLIHVALRKADFFDYNPETSDYDPIDPDNLINNINKRITEKFNEIDAFEVVIRWENMVTDSSSEVIKDILSLTNLSEDKNKKLKDIYYKLAEAMWGRQLKQDASEIATKATSIFNQLLIDRLNFNVNQNLTFNLIKEITPPEKFEEVDKAIFNSRLLLNFDSSVEPFPGNVYEYKDAEIEKPPFSGLIADSLSIPLVSEEFFISTKGEKHKTLQEIREFKNGNKKDYANYEKKIREMVKAVSKFILIEVSPICDFAQKKWKMHRVCPGMLWHSDFAQYIGKSDNLYVSPILYIGKQTYYLVIDLRYFSSTQFETFKAVKPIFNLKHSFLTDIQSLLSRHINRPGITSLS